MPIRLSHFQAEIQCGGDIIMTIGKLTRKDGEKAWYTKFLQSSGGEVGRDVDPSEFDNERPLYLQGGVFLVAQDHRSIDIIIRTLESMRDLMIEDKQEESTDDNL